MMNVYYLTFRSVTPAQRGENLLRKMGYRCVLQRTPRWMEEKGCGYCLRMQTDKIETVMHQLGKNAVAYRKVYRLQPDGEAEEIAV